MQVIRRPDTKPPHLGGSRALFEVPKMKLSEGLANYGDLTVQVELAKAASIGAD
jgi:hypothetical protein